LLRTFRIAGAEPPGRLDLREYWLPAAGFDGYLVSTFGRVQSLDRMITTRTGVRRRIRGRILTASGGDGYPTVSIGGQTIAVHRLVASTFLGPCLPGQMVLHANDDKHDCWLGNLSYDTRSQNVRQAWRHGRHRAGCTEHPPESMFIRSDGNRVCGECLRACSETWHQNL
jgi:hypothetical protein